MDTLDELTFEQALQRLEEIVRKMERGDVELEQSLALFEEGIALSRQCAGRLGEAEERIAVLMKQADGTVSEVDLETGEELE